MARMGVKIRLTNDTALRGIQASDLPALLIKAEEIDLSGLYLRELPAWLLKFKQLRYLSIANNKLTLDKLGVLRMLVNLEKLDLSHNPIFAHHIGIHSLLSPLNQLRVLNLNATGLDNSDLAEGFNYLVNITNLKIDNNSIDIIDLSQMPEALQLLSAKDNKLKEIKFKDLPILSALKVNGNSSLVLPEEFGHTFTLPNLKLLDIDSSVILPEGLKFKLDSWKKVKGVQL